MSQQQIATYTPDASYPAGKTTLVRPALLAVAFTTLTAFQSQAQTFHKLHDFTGGADGSVPLAGLIADRAGNLYGTASTGGGSPFCGDNGCGTAFRMKRSGTGWIFAPLYQFRGGPGDGAGPGALAIATDGLLYGTTTGGGIENCGSRCGTVFQLSPPVTFCRSVLCLWKETLVYRFQGTPDAGNPTGEPVVLDETGNLYGTSMNSGCCDFGAAWELSRSGGGWSDALIYNGFHVGPAISGLVADSAGNLYGTYHLVGYDAGVYQLSRSGSGWHFTQILDLDNLTDGGDSPLGGLFVDNAGNVYRTTATVVREAEALCFSSRPALGMQRCCTLSPTLASLTHRWPWTLRAICMEPPFMVDLSVAEMFTSSVPRLTGGSTQTFTISPEEVTAQSQSATY